MTQYEGILWLLVLGQKSWTSHFIISATVAQSVRTQLADKWHRLMWKIMIRQKLVETSSSCPKTSGLSVNCKSCPLQLLAVVCLHYIINNFRGNSEAMPPLVVILLSLLQQRKNKQGQYTTMGVLTGLPSSAWHNKTHKHLLNTKPKNCSIKVNRTTHWHKVEEGETHFAYSKPLGDCWKRK